MHTLLLLLPILICPLAMAIMAAVGGLAARRRALRRGRGVREERLNA